MKLGVIADDFTGASDIALTLSAAGMPTAFFPGIPAQSTAGAHAASVIALKCRSVRADDAIADALSALAWLRANGAEQIIYKV
ncbi:MAG: four-carbon acid sugar kinase family protein, partial [Pseudomonadota bacterium]